jgi:predicted AAA+ superfamily ATPase
MSIGVLMIARTMERHILERAKKIPVIAILGPRQSGKTTLAKKAFPKHTYISLEDLKNREFAQEDPYAFFQTYAHEDGIILDEIQEVPSLLSYIQVKADSEQKAGYFILTGSQNFLVSEAINQTLAGRISIFTLLPLSINELKKAELLPVTIEELVFNGQYPRLYSFNLNPTDIYPDYIRTYIERDIRSIKNITDLSLFQKFIGLCAGRIGQLLNITSLANDAGISLATAKSWLSLLEASYIIFLLQPYHTNVGKRLVKTPKLYFYDSGVACSLLGIESCTQLSQHYLRGGLVETLLISELYKERYNKGLLPRYYFWRDKLGHEIDCLSVQANMQIPIEIKAGKTPSSDYFDGLAYWYDLHEQNPNGVVLYAGQEDQQRSLGRLVSWRSMPKLEDI